MTITAHAVHDVLTGGIAYASVAYNRLPHPEELAQYPKFQRVYSFFFIFLKAVSLNRSEASK